VAPLTTPEGVGFHRAIEALNPTTAIWFRAATAKRIEASDGDLFIIDGDWRMRVTASAGKPIIRISAGKQELLVPLGRSSGAPGSKIAIDYLW